jgi:uncharacterized protein (TIGR00730 family)
MSTKKSVKTLFPSAEQDISAAQICPPTPQSLSASYKLAYADQGFLLRDELRPVRLQLELLKPELTLQEYNISSTIVIFGSARIPDPDSARATLEQAEQELATAADSAAAQQRLLQARRGLASSRYYAAARELTAKISQHGQSGPEKTLVVITGGGPGIMEAGNRGAQDAQALSIGLNIVLPHEQTPNPYITPDLCFQFHYFALRKMHFLLRARGLVAFPGGFGTLDELFETLTLIQTGKVGPLPIILFGRAFWDRIVNFQALVDEGMISAEDLQLFHYAETADEAWDILASHNGIPRYNPHINASPGT